MAERNSLVTEAIGDETRLNSRSVECREPRISPHSARCGGIARSMFYFDEGTDITIDQVNCFRTGFLCHAPVAPAGSRPRVLSALSSNSNPFLLLAFTRWAPAMAQVFDAP